MNTYWQGLLKLPSTRHCKQTFFINIRFNCRRENGVDKNDTPDCEITVSLIIMSNPT